MSLILAEGFDVYGYSGTTNWLVDSRWSRYSGAVYPYIHSSGYLYLPVQNSGLTTHWAYLNLAAQYSTLFLGMRYYAVTSVNNPSDAILLFQKGSNPSTDQQFVITRTSADALQVRSVNGGSILAQSNDGVVTPGAYQYWEIKGVCHASSGIVIIKIDSVEVINVTSINTQYSGSGGFQYLHFRNYNNDSGKPTLIEDLVVYDNQGTTFKDFMGDLKVIGHLPEADGTDTDWTSTKASHYDAIDNIGNGWSTDYIESSTVGHQDCFTFTGTGTYPTIRAVEVACHGLNSAAGTAKIMPYVRISGNVYYGDELTLSAGSSDKRAYTWTTNPATGTLWSKSVVDAAEFGFEVTEIS